MRNTDMVFIIVDICFKFTIKFITPLKLGIPANFNCN